MSDIFRDVPAFIFLGSIHADPEVGGRVPFICTTVGKERYNSLGGGRGRERNRERLYSDSVKKEKKQTKQTKSIEKWQNKSNTFIPFFLFFLATKHTKEKKINIDHAILPIHFHFGKYFKSPPVVYLFIH